MNARYATSTDSGGTARTAWLMTVLFLASLLNFADRAVFSVLAQTIKVDLRLSDLELGLLQGLLFALLYGLAGLPVGMLAERVRRTSLIAAATAIWSLATAATGLAAGFVQLAAARLAVGFGEAGFTPAAASLVADVTPPQRRSSMIALVQLGSPAGAFLGATIAGAIAAASSWRMSFVAFAVPGLVVARTVAMLINEAADAVHQGVCTADGADAAMKLGVNYPAGPFEWLGRVGAPTVVQLLDALDAHCRGERYRVSPWLRMRVMLHVA